MTKNKSNNSKIKYFPFESNFLKWVFLRFRKEPKANTLYIYLRQVVLFYILAIINFYECKIFIPELDKYFQLIVIFLYIMVKHIQIYYIIIVHFFCVFTRICCCGVGDHLSATPKCLT